jgi:blue copper oxidase
MNLKIPGIALAIAVASSAIAFATTVRKYASRRQTTTYNTLWIPEAISGTTFNLSLKASSKSFFTGTSTPTVGYNGHNFWGPTLIWNKGDKVTLNVTNNLTEETTTHWHGIHLPAVDDGGPHQVIAAGATWSPSFTVTNNASTYWYHPHAHTLTQKQLTLGAGGLIIIKDATEAALKLPRTYGVDDIPLVFTSRRFLSNKQFEYDGDNVKYGDYLLANGVMNAQVSLPQQYVRLRILNAEIERGYNLGFSDNRLFYVIGTDGGLVNKPIAVTRAKLMPGERLEMLVNLGSDKVGSSINLRAYNSNQPFGFPGGEPGTSGMNGSLLNAIDFNMLRINVTAKKTGAITALPATLTTNKFWTMGNATNKRSINITGGDRGGTFQFDGVAYSMTEVSHQVKLGAIEAWTINNNQIFGHAFHIHDTQFSIISRTSGVQTYEQGWKDTLYVPRGESVTFVAQFADYSSAAWPFMFHCHMSNHEDGGLMGQFLVMNTVDAMRVPKKGEINFRNQVMHPLTTELAKLAASQSGEIAPRFQARDTNGNSVSLASLTSTKPLVLYFIERDCPCSRDATAFINHLQEQYGDVANVLGVINSSADDAKAWTRTVETNFPVVADPTGQIIKAYKAKRSVYTTIVGTDGRIARTYPGYSQSTLSDTGSQLARMLNIRARPLDLEFAPKQIITGCSFDFGRISSPKL